VIDHSVQVDAYGSRSIRNQRAARIPAQPRTLHSCCVGPDGVSEFRVVPPDTGIVHQINLEYLASVVFRLRSAQGWEAYPDTLVGTDSHTTMVNGLGVLVGAWAVSKPSLHAGQPVSMLLPLAGGRFKLHGRMPEGCTATDLGLRSPDLAQEGSRRQDRRVYGQGLGALSLADAPRWATWLRNTARRPASSGGRETLAYLTSPIAMRAWSNWWKRIPRSRPLPHRRHADRCMRIRGSGSGYGHAVDGWTEASAGSRESARCEENFEADSAARTSLWQST